MALGSVSDPTGLLRFQKCEHCRRMGATIPCRAAGCPRLYHFPCAAASGCFQSMKTLRLLCPEHVAEAVQMGACGLGPPALGAGSPPALEGGSQGPREGAEPSERVVLTALFSISVQRTPGARCATGRVTCGTWFSAPAAGSTTTGPAWTLP